MDLADDLYFKPTKRIKRIINTIYDVYQSNVSSESKTSVYIKVYEGEETVSLKEDELTYLLLDYLSDNKIADVAIGKSKVTPTKVKQDHWLVTELDVTVINGEKLGKLNAALNKHTYDRASVSFSENGTLMVNKNPITFNRGTPAYDLLHLIFIDGESPDDIWSYSEGDTVSLAELVYRSGNRSVKDFCRDIGNYVNRRIKQKTGIPDFLLVNSKSIQLNPEFV